MRSRIIAAGSAVVVAGVILLGAGPAFAASAPPPEPSGGVGAEASALSPQLEQLVESGAQPGTPAGAAASATTPRGAGSLQTDASGRLVVTATFSGTPGGAALDGLRALGAEIVAVSPVLPKVTVYIPTDRLAALAALDGVTGVAADLKASGSSAAPARTTGAATAGAGGAVTSATLSGSAAGATSALSGAAPSGAATGATSAVAGAALSGAALAAPSAAAAAAAASCRSIPVDVDPALKSDQARAAFGVDGTGVTVGIISTSFNTSTTAVTHEAQDIAAGLLPGPGNPCGYLERTRVIGTDPVSTDEGRGMAQMVHGVAPGARLLFSSGAISSTSFASSVVNLTDAGADVIVDDLSILTEPMYQEGEAAQAIDYAVAHGVLFFSAAGNYSEIGIEDVPDEGYAIGGWESSVYTPTACPAAVLAAFASAIDCHDFGTAGSPDATNTIVAQNNANGTFTLLLNWAEPVNGTTGEYLPVLLDESGDIILDPTTHLPISIGARYDNASPLSAAGLALPSAGRYQIVVVRELGGYAPITAGFKFIFPEDAADTVVEMEYFRNTDTVTVGPNLFGHTADRDVVSVGAAWWQQPNVNDVFSSVGPVTHLFGPIKADNSASDRLAAPEMLAKPDLTSLDGAQTSFFETEAAPGVYVFFGTSAASPNAAGVAALALQHSPQSTAADVRRAMTATAAPMTNIYTNVSGSQVSGAGRLDALATLTALPAAPAPVPVPASAGNTTLAATGDPVTPALSAGVFALLALAGGATALVVRRRIRMSQN